MRDSKFLENISSRDLSDQVIADFDEVIAICKMRWVSKMIEHPSFINLKIIKDAIDNDSVIRDLVLTDEYYIQDNIPEIKNSPELFNEFLNLYINDSNFYTDHSILPFGKALATLSHIKWSKPIIIISQCIGGTNTPAANSKLAFIRRHFNEKTIIHFTETGNGKQEIIKNYPEWDLLVEDSVDNIISMLNVTSYRPGNPRDVIIPYYSWNENTINKLKKFEGINIMHSTLE
jgi:hypothetical protein